MEIKEDEIVEIEKMDCNEEFMDLHTELGNYVANGIVVHNSFPSRRSQSVGVYMPSIKKERVDIVVAIDTSGSISQTELTEFISEVVAISKSFHNIKITVIECDCAVQQVLVCENGNIDTIMDMKVKGGGGTSFNPPVEYMKEEMPTAKCLIYFTDGHGDLSVDNPFKTIWVISSNGTEDSIQDKGIVLRVE